MASVRQVSAGRESLGGSKCSTKFLQDSTQNIITTTFRGFVVELGEGFNMVQTCTIQ